MENKNSGNHLSKKLLDAKKQAALETIRSKYFNREKWPQSRFLCVADDVDDGAQRALDYCRWNIEDASKLIESTLAWREEEKIDEILNHKMADKDVAAIRAAFGDGFFGQDLEGYPIYWCPAGQIDIASLKDKVSLSDMLRYHIQLMEFNQQVYLRRISGESNRTIHNFTGVLDLKGFGARNLNKAFRECLSVVSIIDRDYYYDNFHKVIIMNAPTIFRLFWKTTSALYRAETKAKFLLLDRPEDLFKHVDPAITPVQFGGNYDGNDALFSKDNSHTKHSKEMDAYLEKLNRMNE